MITIISITSFIFIAGMIYLMAQMLIKAQQDPVRRRLATASSRTGTWMGGQRSEEPLAGHLTSPNAELTELDKDLRRAGYYKSTAREEFLAMRATLAVLVIIVTGTIAVMIGPKHDIVVLQVLGAGLVLTVFFWALPVIVLSIQGKRRVNKIRTALPDALDLLSMCMSGGMTLEDGITQVSHDLFVAHPDLAVEFVIIRYQADMNSLEFAFDQLASRVDGPEIVSLRSLIIQNLRLGTNVAASIRQFGDDLRLQRRQAADERSYRAEFLMLFPVVFCLLPALLIFLWTPAVMELVEFFYGGGAAHYIPR